MSVTKISERKTVNSWTILVVGEDEGLRMAMVDVLDLFGYEAEAVSSGEEALATFDETRHALLITDGYMPGMHGAELIQALRRRCPSLPMIVLMGAEEEEDLRAAGASEILRKPFDIGEIREAIERNLQGKILKKRGKERESRSKEMKCPYYEKVRGTMARKSVRGYCTGYLAHGMVVPSIMEEKKYCFKANGFLSCPIYRSRQMVAEGSEAEQMDLCFTVL
ncbi:MAG: response regulator [Candidatus Tectomicrobia bacterium]|uniref:Response regulator n=1 Tax=Tectimicrobiota bacterium TaxID=2528274 RepID=A0A932CPX3_UNCTE|nr:response regulator [Candidatus Tectomicrobia bacterium]